MSSVKTIAKETVAVMLAMLISLSFLFSFFVHADVNNSDYDYSRPGGSSTARMDSADLIEYILGEEIGEAERSYLVSYGDLSLDYDDGITTSLISAVYDGGELEIYAKEYYYETSDGRRVVWTPTYATLAGEPPNDEDTRDGEYYATFSDAADSGVESVSVIYSLSLSISAEDANALLNKAINDVPKIEAEIAEKTEKYQAALNDYLLAKERYDVYVEQLAEYTGDVRLYSEYLSAYRIYAEALDAYNEYLSDLESYDASIDAYNKYLEDIESYEKNYPLYLDYLAEREEYLSELEEYNKYASTVASFRSRLEIIEYTRIKMTSLRRSLYAAVLGNMVDTVLKERDALEANSVGAPSGVIDLAGEATENLRELLTDYFSFETETAKYNYYCDNYEAFKKNFCDLFAALDYLYTNPAVRSYIYNVDREEKYRILLAQLFEVATAISDEPVRSVAPALVVGGRDEKNYRQFSYTESYRIDLQGYSTSAILGADCCLADTGAAYPVFEPFPAEREEPIEPERVDEPIKPETVTILDKPKEVDNPGDPPTFVEDPGEAPTPVDEPIGPPQQYVIPKEYEKLLAVKDSLVERPETFSEPISIVISKSVSKKFINVEEVTVRFYSEEQALLYELTVDAGTYAGYHGPVPHKAEDDRATYTFVGWQNSDGEEISLDCVVGDQLLYPLFAESVKTYNVTFSIDGNDETVSFKYGEIPFYTAQPRKSDDSFYTYTFSSWDREPSAVTGDARYVAVFDKKYIVPTSFGGASVSYDGKDYTVDLLGALDTAVDISGVLSKARNSAGILIKAETELYLSISVVNSLESAGACKISVRTTDRSGDAFAYSVFFTGRDGELISGDFPVRLTDSRVGFAESDRLRLFTEEDDGARAYHKFTYDNGSLTFTAKDAKIYTFSYEYRLSAVASGLITLNVDKKFFTVGEEVNVTVSIPEGVRVTRIARIASDGSSETLKNGRFTMPGDDVTLVVEAERVKYKISFVNDGMTMSSFYCYHGDTPLVPESPKKASDSTHGYRFVGWDKDIKPATDSVTYYAVYDTYEIEQKVDTDTGLGMYLSANLILVVILGALGAVFLIALLLLFKRILS